VSAGPPSLAAIEAAIESAGLVLRGAFHPGPDDSVPALGDGRKAATLALVGNAGPGMWEAFARSPERADGADHALDRWTRRVLGEAARALGATALFPFGGPPYLPFQRWAMRAEAVAPSPIGPLIHPEYGLWHAYRGALAFAETIALPPRPALASPCESCAEKPCLSTCPVGAFSAQGYDVAACAAHIETAAGADCMDLGCRARRACPVGRAHVYGPAQARFHMEAFRANRRKARAQNA